MLAVNTLCCVTIMTTMFIADIHLCSHDSYLHDLFSYFINTTARAASSLYILGDLFDYWVEDYQDPFNLSIINLLHALATHGTQVYYVRGNRDLLIGRKFAELTNCKVLPDFNTITIAGETILLMHGDLLCALDSAYVRWRAFAHNPYVKAIFLSMPYTLRSMIAQFLRRKSAQHTISAAPVLLDADQRKVISIMRQYHVQHLIHGHTHKPAEHTFYVEGQLCRRTVLAPWHNGGQVLIHYADGRRVLQNFS